MPLIAIARCGKTHDYIESVRSAGGEPWVLDPAVDRADSVIRAAGGLLLTGGDDVRPDLYGATPHPSFEGSEAGRDEYEIELVSRAIEADVPIFAICRGIQLLNVARGGTLVQDIPTERPSTVSHRLPTPAHAADEIAHTIHVEPDSLLSALVGSRLSDAATCSVEQPTSPGGRSARRWIPDHRVRARRYRRGRRGCRRASSALACSGTRRASIAQASSFRSSKPSSARAGGRTTRRERVRPVL